MKPRRDISQPHKFEPLGHMFSVCGVYDSVRAETCSLAASNEIHKIGTAGKDPATVPTETSTHFADCREGNHDECLYQFPDPANPSETLTCGCEHHLRPAQGDGQSSVSFTPGPWEVSTTEFGGSGAWPCVRGALDSTGGWVVALIDDGCISTSDNEPQANARLIAAAPALYEALFAAVHALRSYEHGNANLELAEEIANVGAAVLAAVEMTKGNTK